MITKFPPQFLPWCISHHSPLCRRSCMSVLSAGRRMDTYSSSDLSHACYWPKPRRQWFMHSSLRVLTTVTRCCSVSLTIFFGVFRPHKMLHHVLFLLVPDVVSASSRLDATLLAASATAHSIQPGSYGVQSDKSPVSTIFDG